MGAPLPGGRKHCSATRWHAEPLARLNVLLWRLAHVVGAKTFWAYMALDVALACLTVDDDAEVAAEGSCPASAQVCGDSLSSPLAPGPGEGPLVWLLHHLHLIHPHHLTIWHGCPRSVWPRMRAMGSGRWFGVVGGPMAQLWLRYDNSTIKYGKYFTQSLHVMNIIRPSILLYT